MTQHLNQPTAPDPDDNHQDFEDIVASPQRPEEFPNIPWEIVPRSEWIKSYRYIPARMLIQCIKHDGTKYDLRSTPADYEELCQAPSKGRYFSRRFDKNRKAREAAFIESQMRIGERRMRANRTRSYWEITQTIPPGPDSFPPPGWAESIASGSKPATTQPRGNL